VIPAPSLLAGATVQKIDVAADLAVLRLRTPGATFFLVITAGRSGPLVGLTRVKPFKGTGIFSKEGTALPLGEKIRIRTRLEGAKVVGIGERRALFLREDAASLVLEGGAAPGARVALREARAGDDRLDALAPAEDVELWCARGEELVRGFGEGALAARRIALGRSLARALVKIERRMKAIRGDLDRLVDADRLAEQAAAFVAAAARAPRGARSLTVMDWSSGEPRAIDLALDPARSAREQLEAMFKRAKRLKLGSAIARRRLGEAEAAWEALALLNERATIAESYEAIDALAVEARKAAPREFALGAGTASGPGKRDGGKTAPSRPYRVFRGESGAKILSGKGAAGNDALTLHVARPHDLWLHAKGRTGAHVIVPLEKNSVCPAELLVEAAHVAAHFSEGREEGVIEIQHTPRRYVRKPKGAAPGLVIVEREKVLVLRVDPATTARLLAGEELG
jgi:hypothetical protein